MIFQTNVLFFTRNNKLNLKKINVKGDCTIIKPGDSFQKVAENSVGETVKAVPAFVRGKMVLRTEKNLYMIE
jgi:outer membrane protein assembly factor BamB